jgi:lipoprotein-releasing system permease protein
MRLELFIARRLIKGADGKSLLSRPAVILAVITVMLGMAAMALSVMIVGGFKKNISEKLTGFTAHLRISRFDLNSSFEQEPIERDTAFERTASRIKGIKSLYPFAYKNGIIKTDSEVQGIVLKGIDSSFFNTNFQKSIIEGRLETHAVAGKQPVMISRKLSELLNKKTGDEMLLYFIQEPPRIRKMLITGVYDTGMEEFDRMFAFGSLELIQKLNGWNPENFTGYEIEASNYAGINKIKPILEKEIPPLWKVETVYDLFPQIFNWLQLVDVNTVIIVTLIIIIAVINLMIVLLILILEQSLFTGVMKVIGAGDTLVRKVFILMTGFILITGMAAGNLLSLLIAFLQLKFRFITLPEDSYYMRIMPVEIDPVALLMLNMLVILVVMLVLIIPSAIVRSISPASVLRFDCWYP